MTSLIPPEYLSASSIFTFLQCPMKYKFGRIDGMKEDPTEATLMGNFVHDVLEDFYGHEKDERTIDLARSLARSLWDSKWGDEITQWVPANKLANLRWNAWWCIENLWKLEDPQNIEPTGLETEIDVPIGGVRLKGYIDRWSKNENDRLVITDYKSGKTPKPRYQDDKYTQLVIYALAVEALGYGHVDEIELLFLKGPDRLRRKITDDDRSTVTKMIVQTRKSIEECCENEFFETRPTRLCDWCSFKPICPYWNK